MLFYAFYYFIVGLSGSLVAKNGSTIGIPNVLPFLIILGSGAIVSLVAGSRYKQRGKKYIRYVHIVNSGHNHSIDSIAKAVPTTPEKALADIQNMIAIGYFKDSYVDFNRRELIMPLSHVTSNPVMNNPYGPAVQVQPPQPRTVQCPNCGATNTIMPGLPTECEYCGSPQM